MTNFFDYIKNIYQKNNLKPDEWDMSSNIAVSKWLSKDKDCIHIVKKLLHYLFYLEPINYYYLLYFNLPKKFNIPYFKKIEKEEAKENKVYEKIRYILNWSSRELELNKKILDKVIDEKYWKKELGIK